MNWYDLYPPSKITELLYVGNNHNAACLFGENLIGFHAVLNVSTEPRYLHRENVQYYDVPFPDGAEIPEDCFNRCMEFLLFNHNLKRKTLVHCAAGISRSPTTTAAFLHYSKQMDFPKAMLHIIACRPDPSVQPHPDVVRSVKKYLKLWPYDGSLSEGELDDLSKQRFVQSRKLTRNEFIKLILDHPDPTCQFRDAYGSTQELAEGVQAHEIPCTCKK